VGIAVGVVVKVVVVLIWVGIAVGVVVELVVVPIWVLVETIRRACVGRIVPVAVRLSWAGAVASGADWVSGLDGRSSENISVEAYQSISNITPTPSASAEK